MSRRQLIRAASLLLSLALLGLAHADAPDASATADKQLLDFGGVTINFDSGPQVVTFQNLGAQTARVFSFVMQPADAPFKVGETTCVTAIDNPSSATTLATQQSCIVSFVAHPNVTGPATATFNIHLFTVDTGAFLQSTTVYLLVNGLAPPPVVVTSDKPLLNFGDLLVNTQSATQFVTLTNQGTQDLTITGAGITADPGFVGAGFTVSGGTYFSFGVIAPGASRTMVIQAIPTVAGSQGASVLLFVKQQNQPATAVLAAHVRANALPLPASPSPSPVVLKSDKPSLNFGDVLVNAQSAPQTVTVTNQGTQNLSILGASIAYFGSRDFTLSGGTCLNYGPLARGASCTLVILIAPTVAGSQSANIFLDVTQQNQPGTRFLATYAQANALPLPASPSPPPVVLKSDKPLLNFGDVLVNTQSAPQTVTVTNQGTQALTISTPIIQYLVGVDFTFSAGTCFSVGVLAPGASCTIVILATPVVAGSQGANIFLDVTQQNQPGTRFFVTYAQANAVLGMSLPASPVPSPSPSLSPSPKPSPSPSPVPSPKVNTMSMASPSPSPNTNPSTVTVTPALLEFGNVPFGSSSGFKALTFINTGSKKIHIQSVALTAAAGYQGAGFSLANNGNSCYVGKGLKSGASCTVWVKATPTTQGSNGANVYLTYKDTAGVAGTSQMALVHASAVPVARRALRA